MGSEGMDLDAQPMENNNIMLNINSNIPHSAKSKRSKLKSISDKNRNQLFDLPEQIINNEVKV
jgi:hypothetical protein